MYIRTNFHHLISISPTPGARPFDSFRSLGYEYNSHGFIRNDISQLQETENSLSFMRALSAMQEYTEEHSNEGKTFEEIVRAVRPRWCQLNGEVDRFEQYLIDNALEYYKTLRDDDSVQSKVVKDVATGVGIEPTADPAVVK